MNDDSKVVVQQGGIGIGTLCFFATLIFAILKLAGVIAWSWWLVFAPLLFYVGIVVAIIAVILLVIGIVAIVAAVASR